MNIVEIIEKKKHNIELSIEEIKFVINGLMNGDIDDYQISALMMAIYFNSMTNDETINLTNAMINSGDVIDLSSIHNPTVDKHSTGGVGDKTSLILGPLLATFDLSVAKMSGRGLGHTGGTLDKLEALEGFKIEISDHDFIKQVNEHGVAIIGQTGELVPADKKLYALRDVTATVDSLPLIAASIMSKKIASGAHTIILDVKYGSGAFMKTINDAEELAKTLVMIGNGVGRKTIAAISSMSQPLGDAIGNSLEVQEAMDTLKGHGPSDVEELCTLLAIELL
ncbi:MAG: thymidine phosphorylase, partial [Mycoplasmatales bacterium]